MGDLRTRPSPRWSQPRCARIRAARSPPCSPGCWSAKTSSSRATCSPSTPSTGPSPSRLRSPTASGCSSVFAIRSARARIGSACSPTRQPRGRRRQALRTTSPAAGGGKALVDQAQSLGAGVQRRLAEVGRGVESQVTTLIVGLEERLSDRLDVLLDRLAVSLRRDLDRVRERVRALENRLADVPKEGMRELVAPLQAIASGAGERASAALARIEELSVRLPHTERRIAEVTRETTRETLDTSDLLQRMERGEQRLTDLGREVGTKLGELGALRERLTRIEGRVVDSSKDQISRSGEAAGV